MAFQNSMTTELPIGIVGEYASAMAGHGVRRAVRKRLQSSNANRNVIGRAFQALENSDDGVSADIGTETIFSGILGFPRSHQSFDYINPGFDLPNQTSVELIQEGNCYVNSASACKVGDDVIYSFVDGTIDTKAKADALPADFGLVPNGIVVTHSRTNAGIIEIYLNAKG